MGKYDPGPKSPPATKWNLFLETARFVLLRWLIVGDLDAFGKEQQLKGAVSPRDLW